jgi:hypothetical protein
MNGISKTPTHIAYIAATMAIRHAFNDRKAEQCILPLPEHQQQDKRTTHDRIE